MGKIVFKYNYQYLIISLIFIMPFTTSYLFLFIKKAQIKEHAKLLIINTINRNELILLKFTKEESQKFLEWEDCNEFKYKGLMYDVLKKQIKKDSMYLLCIIDHKENKINKKLSNLVHLLLGNDSQNKKNAQDLKLFSKNLFFSFQQLSLFKPFFQINSFIKNMENYTSYIIQIPVPPPKHFE